MTRIFEARAPGKARLAATRPAFLGGASGGILRRFGLWAVLVIVTAAFMIASSTFRQTTNLENILEQNSIIGVVACGMVVMMIAGGFDLSVGAVGATASVAGPAVAAHQGTILAIITGLAIGIGVGAVNGFLVARVKVNAFIATFAMASIVSGLLYVATSAQSEQGNSAFLSAVAGNRWGGIPIVFVVFVVFLVAVWLTLTRTRYGHYVYSVGGNAEASHLSGCRSSEFRCSPSSSAAPSPAWQDCCLQARRESGSRRRQQTGRFRPLPSASWPAWL
jgi:ribose/xylose/arabinose/galactoside ABC-type transport system permease subunit